MHLALDSTLFDGGNSTLVMFALAASTVELLLGVAIGWWLRGSKKIIVTKIENGVHVAEDALSNLHDLAHRVKADVGAHTSQVSAISNELSTPSKDGATSDVKVMSAVSKILEANQRLEEQLQNAESKLHEQAETIRIHAAQAMTDSLTGLGNRRAFDSELSRRIAEFERRGTALCLAILDVDHFKKFNDAHGHLAGDEVLRLVGETLKQAARSTDFVARYGGEEFAIVMPQANVVEALNGAERIRTAIQHAYCQFEGKELRVTASFGIAPMLIGESAATLVQSADEALYDAKQGGRNQVQVYKPRKDATREVSKPVAPQPEPNAVAPKAAPATLSMESHVHDSRTDVLTGLPNRTSFCEDVRRRISESQRHGNRLAVILIQIDELDELVADHGLPAAELVMKTCTQFLSAAMREMDLVARYDVNMFGIVLPGTALVHASCAGDRLRAAIERCPLQWNDRKFNFSISAGVAESQPGEDMVAFITRAEEAKKVSLSGGGNKVHFHTGISVEPAPDQAPAA
jgi:diguanylate cyclase